MFGGIEMSFSIRIALMVSSISLLLMITACNMKSEATILKEVEEVSEAMFEEKESIKANHQLDSLTLYIPEHLTIDEEDDSNIILSNQDQIYIIFINHLEKPTSKLNYKAAQNSQALLMKSFQDNDSFGYIQVIPEDDNTYELQIGVGGIKITTLTNKRKVVTDAEDLMKIAISTMNNNDLYE